MPVSRSVVAVLGLFVLLAANVGPCHAVRPLASDLLMETEAKVVTDDVHDVEWWPFSSAKNLVVRAVNATKSGVQGVQNLAASVVNKTLSAPQAVANVLKTVGNKTLSAPKAAATFAANVVSRTVAAPKAVAAFAAKVVNRTVAAPMALKNVGSKVVNMTKGSLSGVKNMAVNFYNKTVSRVTKLKNAVESRFDNNTISSRLSQLRTHWTNLAATARNQSLAIKRTVESFGERAGELMQRANATAKEINIVTVELVLLNEQWNKVSAAATSINATLRTASAAVAERESALNAQIKNTTNGTEQATYTQKLTALRAQWGNITAIVHSQGALLYNATTYAASTVADLTSSLRRVWSNRTQIIGRLQVLRQQWQNLTEAAAYNEELVRNATKNLTLWS